MSTGEDNTRIVRGIWPEMGKSSTFCPSQVMPKNLQVAVKIQVKL